jgi:splicing factor 3B subunit 1
MPEFFRMFWTRKNNAISKSSRQLIETTVEVASQVGGAEIITMIVDDLKDENENY